MKRFDSLKNKMFILFLSSVFVLVFILLYFLDDWLDWNFYKITSCMIVNLWCFFLIPALRNSYLYNERKSLEEWFKMGFSFGAGGMVLPILLAPFYGIKYYFNK